MCLNLDGQVLGREYRESRGRAGSQVFPDDSDGSIIWHISSQFSITQKSAIMSRETETPRPSKDEFSRKQKERSETKSRKKRRRDDQSEPQALEVPQPPPTKKQRIEEHPTSQSAGRSGSDATHSPFHVQTSSLYLPLSPICQNYQLDGICAEHLSPLLLTYYPPLKGVVLSYSNVRLSEFPEQPASTDIPVLARAMNEYAVNFLWVTVDFVVLKPRKGIWVDGWVNLQNESHLGLVCWNLFSASIERKRLPKEWKWIDNNSAINGLTNESSEDHVVGDGHFVDADGAKVDGLIKFRVRDFETAPASENERGFISIEGTLLGEEEEQELSKKEMEQQRERVNGIPRRGRPPSRILGARPIESNSAEGSRTVRSIKS